jgi:hypothetical protein
MRIKAPKTKRGRRTISIPPSLVAELRAHRKAQEEIWLRLGLGKVKDESLVFTTWYGEPRTPNALSKGLERDDGRLWPQGHAAFAPA